MALRSYIPACRGRHHGRRRTADARRHSSGARVGSRQRAAAHVTGRGRACHRHLGVRICVTGLRPHSAPRPARRAWHRRPRACVGSISKLCTSRSGCTAAASAAAAASPASPAGAASASSSAPTSVLPSSAAAWRSRQPPSPAAQGYSGPRVAQHAHTRVRILPYGTRCHLKQQHGRRRHAARHWRASGRPEHCQTPGPLLPTSVPHGCPSRHGCERGRCAGAAPQCCGT